MKKAYISLPLAILLTFSSGCGKNTPTVPKPTSPVSSAVPTPLPRLPSPTPEASEEPPLTWTITAVLAPEDLPEMYNGLELPIHGATGYASIELPLWADPQDAQAAAQAVADWTAAQEAEEALDVEAAPTVEPEIASAPTAAPVSEVVPMTEIGPTPEAEPTPGPTATPGEAPPPEPAVEHPEEKEQAGDVLPGTEETESPDSGEPDGPGVAEASQPPEPELLPDAPSEETTPPTLTDGALTILPPGAAFTILAEDGPWWQIQYHDPQFTALTGWVEHRWCMINLPDVIPSMIYNATNAYSSRFVSCGKPLAGVTGQALYPGKTLNARLSRQEFMMPVLYSMSLRLCAAQRVALQQGNCLVLYEGYRPYETQRKVSGALAELMRQDSAVRHAVSDPPWSISWFIATGTSNHQHGYAVDVSLARIQAAETDFCGSYPYLHITKWKEYTMPTAVHELSNAAATFTAPTASNSKTAWVAAELAPSMNDAALGLQGYCTGAGLTPLASEWWHFNDLDSRSQVLAHLGAGQFVIRSCVSTPP